jgi:signal transduction histidine kinase
MNEEKLYYSDTENEIRYPVSENNELNLFFAAVAHELKSPVNALIMLIDLFKNEADERNDSSLKELAGILSSKASGLSEKIESLMNFSRISSIIPEIEPVYIGALFKDVFDELHSLEPDRNIILEIDELPVINGDDVLIEILVKNLLSNAFKFTAVREKAVITVRYNNKHDHHIISVRDNGIGFEMKDADSIFQIFTRLNASEKYEGHGVGLALCRRIMTRHGGRIEAKSVPDEGTEFILYFPKPVCPL